MERRLSAADPRVLFPGEQPTPIRVDLHQLYSLAYSQLVGRNGIYLVSTLPSGRKIPHTYRKIGVS